MTATTARHPLRMDSQFSANRLLSRAMVRLIPDRLKRFARAPFVPRSNSFRELVRTAPTLVVIARVLTEAIGRRLERVKQDLGRRPRPVRVGVDIRPFYEPLTGVGWYLFHLLEELEVDPSIEIVLFGDSLLTADGPFLHVTLPGNLQPVTFDLRNRELSRFSRPILGAAFALLARIEGCDVFFGANYFLPRSLGAVAGRRVVTVHDLTFRRFPELLQTETLENLQREMERELFRSDAIISVSEATRRDLLTYFQVDARKVKTIHSGLATMEQDDSSDALPLPSRFILFVSTIEPRKNLDTLLDAFEGLKRDGTYEGALVVVGKVGWKSEATMQRMASSRWCRFMIHLDYVPRGQLAGIYRRADVFVLPSHYEGFGFTLLEAMALGVASIAARSSSLPEVGGDAALYFEPADAHELAERIFQVTSDDSLRQKLITAGLAQAGRYRWSATARETAALLRRVAGRDA
ncbi:MAG: glycosyltransferase family 1 protein [Acidobacteriota bacterium]